MSHINADEIAEYLKNEELNENTKIYLGVDSQAFKRKGEWFADFYMVVIVHRNGNNGCKLFYEKVTERDYSVNKKKPTYRLLQEVYKVSEIYARVADVISDYEVEIHLDLNPNKRYASSAVVPQAIGYIKASCNIVPLIKPQSFASSHCADKLIRTNIKK